MISQVGLGERRALELKVGPTMRLNRHREVLISCEISFSSATCISEAKGYHSDSFEQGRL